MFTSIVMLRNTSAATDRVNSVERNLKKMNAAWQAEWLFPVAAVGLSNSTDDITWVARNKAALLPNTGKHLFVPIDDGIMQITASQLIAATVDLSRLDSISPSNKTAIVVEILSKVDATLKELIGGSYSSWYFNPIMVEPPKMKGATLIDSPTAKVESAGDNQPQPDEQVTELPAATASVAEVKNGLDQLQLRKWFETAFADDIQDFAFATTPKNPRGKYANDRTQGKFVGFVTGIQLVASGVIVVGK